MGENLRQPNRSHGWWLVVGFVERARRTLLASKAAWFDKGDGKFYHAYLDLDRQAIHLRSGEDKEVEPERAKFIKKMLDKWELEWLQDEAKK